MKNEKYILDEAVDSLFKYTKIQAIVKNTGLRSDILIEIANEKFAGEIEISITKGNKGIILARLKEIARENNLPVLLVTGYIPVEIAKEYTDEGINYLDIAGNCHIREHKLLIHIDGKKNVKTPKVNQPRAFQEAGIKLIFQFLIDPEKTKLPYRDLAELSNISLGSVGRIMQELNDLNFILKTRQTKKLKNTKELINRWITAYHDVLRPRLLKRQMSFINQESYNKWREISLEQNIGDAFWGGEPGANLLTGYLHPGIFTIYTNHNWQSFKDIGFVPDENGNVEVLEMFWKTETYQGVPPILVYADLMNSSSDRNIETANMILKNELQYLQ
jgi:hypothetical protein